MVISHRIVWLVWIANLVALLGIEAAIKCQKAGAGDNKYTKEELTALGIDASDCSTASKCKGEFTIRPGKVKWTAGCGACERTKKTSKKCFECSAGPQCRVLPDVIDMTHLNKCPQFDGKKSELLALSKLPIIYCTGSDAEKKCNQFTYTDSGEEKVWIGCQPDCAAAKTSAGVTATECVEYEFKCPTGNDIKTYTEVTGATLTTCAADVSTNRCRGTITPAKTGKKKQKWTLACGECASGKDTTCFECDASGCNIEKAKKIPKNKVIKCPEFHDTKASLTPTVPYIYCADTAADNKCHRVDYELSSTDKVWLGCKADYIKPGGGAGEDKNDLTHSCPQAKDVDTEAKLLATEAAICIKPSITKCSGNFTSVSGTTVKVKWTLACDECRLTKGKTCFECDASECNIEKANKIPKEKVIKCPSFTGAKTDASKGISSKIYCAGNDDERKCNQLEYGDKVWIGCAGDCAGAKKRAGVEAASAECKECKGNCEIKIVPKKTGDSDSDSDSGKGSDKNDKGKDTAKGDDAKKNTKKQSSQLLPGNAIMQALLALSMCAALVL